VFRFRIASTLALVFALNNLASAQTVPTVRWHTDPISAYNHAVWEQKPIVAYFYPGFCGDCGGKCRNCQQLEQEVLLGPTFANLADKAVFLLIDCNRRNTDSIVANLLSNLRITVCPVVSILDTTGPNLIVERGRVVGNLPLREFQERFTAQWNYRGFSKFGAGVKSEQIATR
jgi:hypothetical protein